MKAGNVCNVPADKEQVICNSAECHTDDGKTDKETPNRISCDSIAIKEKEDPAVDVNGDSVKENPNQDEMYTCEKDSACYMDKSVMVCYKDSACHAVKDICVDEGVTVHDKFLSENGADEKDLVKCISIHNDSEDQTLIEEFKNAMPPGKSDFLSIPVVETEKSEAEITEKDSDMIPGSGACQSSSKNDSNKLVSVRNDSEDQTLIEELDNGTPSKADFLSIPVVETEKSEAEITEKGSEMTGLGACQCSSKNDSNDHVPACNDSEDQMLIEKLNNGTRGKTGSDMPGSGACQCSSKNDSNERVPARNDSEDQTLIEEFENGTQGKTDNSIPIEPLTLGYFLSMGNNHNISNNELVEQSSQSLDWSKSSETAGDSNVVPESNKTTNSGVLSCGDKNAELITPSPVSASQEPVSESQISLSGHNELKNKWLQEDSNDSNLFQRGLGETSFSVAAPVSGLITYTGPITFSGNLSVRSDGSNASTRSFAFPVLQSEWNFSPVRMARPDRRQLRRQKESCCEFGLKHAGNHL